MPIYRILKESAFDADEAKVIAGAYEGALERLRLQDRSDPLTELVAHKIIEVYRNGEHDTIRLRDRALNELGVSVPD